MEVGWEVRFTAGLEIGHEVGLEVGVKVGWEACWEVGWDRWSEIRLEDFLESVLGSWKRKLVEGLAKNWYLIGKLF